MRYLVCELLQQPAVRFISQSNELREKDCHQSQSFFVCLTFICQYFSINLVRLKHAVIYVALRMEEHAIREEFNFKFVYECSSVNIEHCTVCIMSCLWGKNSSINLGA